MPSPTRLVKALHVCLMFQLVFNSSLYYFKLRSYYFKLRSYIGNSYPHERLDATLNFSLVLTSMFLWNCYVYQAIWHKWNIEQGMLMQMWKSAYMFIFIWKHIEDFTLKHLLIFELCAREICEICEFVYKHSETIE